MNGSELWSPGPLASFSRELDEPAAERNFAVVRPFPVLAPGPDELAVPPLEYASIASRPEPVRVV